jgi:hypothetical protein
MKPGHVIAKTRHFVIIHCRTVPGRLNSIGHTGGKDHTGGFAAFFAVGFRQQPENFEKIRFGRALIAGYFLSVAF